MNFIKIYLILILENALDRLRNDKCTTEEMESAYNICKDNLITNATASEIAEKFDQKPRLVHDAINRNRWGTKLKPSRKVYFNMSEVLSILPKGWFKFKN